MQQIFWIRQKVSLEAQSYKFNTKNNAVKVKRWTLVSIPTDRLRPIQNQSRESVGNLISVPPLNKSDFWSAMQTVGFIEWRVADRIAVSHRQQTLLYAIHWLNIALDYIRRIKSIVNFFMPNLNECNAKLVIKERIIWNLCNEINENTYFMYMQFNKIN